MDALVARYSQPAIRHEGYSQEDQEELMETVPSLSLKFALPPVANVSLRLSRYGADIMLQELSFSDKL
jgi:hypothetical protein